MVGGVEVGIDADEAAKVHEEGKMEVCHCCGVFHHV